MLRGGANPVVLVDFLWGKFLDGVDPTMLLSAYIALTDELLQAADAEREPGDPAQIQYICAGGPPPMAYIKACSTVMEANYPERCGSTAIYPVPWVVKAMVDTMLAFLPRRTKAK